MLLGIIVALTIAVAGGTSIAAESSLPGDTLYPVKIHVNENIESAFTFGNESEAELQVELIEQRVDEMSELSQKGELTANLESEIGTQIELHSDQYQEEKESMEVDDPITLELQARYEYALSGLSIISVNTDIVESGDMNSQSVLSSDNNSELSIDYQTQVSNQAQDSDETETSADTEISIQADINSQSDIDITDGASINTDTQAEIDTYVDLSAQNILDEIETNIDADTETSSSIGLDL